MIKKRHLLIAAAILIALSIAGLTPDQTFAAAKQQPVYVSIYAMGGKTCREKLGNYYIWIMQKGNVSYLKCAKSASSTGKTLHKVKGENKWISNYMVSNGTTIYYAVNEETEHGVKAVIYKASVKGKRNKLRMVSAQAELYGYNKGMLYYGAQASAQEKGKRTKPADLSAEKTGGTTEKHFDGRMDLYSYDTGKKSTKLLKKSILGESGYGAYLTYVNTKNGNLYLYHTVSKKSTKLPRAEEAVISGKKVYYYNQSKDKVIVKSCSLSGKNAKIVKTLKDVRVDYLGRKAIFFSDYNTGKQLKMNYNA